MFKFLFSFTLLSASIATEEAGYPADPYGYGADPYGYGGHKPGGYYRKSFPPARPIIDPKYYKTILEGFQQCVHHKCNALPHAYTSSYEDSLESIGEYTACVTSCAASEMMRVCIDLKSLLAKLLDIGSSHLASAHRYLAGTKYYDVLGNNTRIDDSCCLPKDYFVPFENLVFLVPSGAGPSTEYFVGVKEYLDYCLQSPETTDTARPYFIELGLACNIAWMKYFRELQLNTGHVVLSPKCDSLAPDDACSETLQDNPRAASYGSDMCVAYEWENDGQTREFETPLLRYPSGPVTSLACEDESFEGFTIKYHRVPSSHLKYFTVLTGLPISETPCTYTQGLAAAGDGGKFTAASPPNAAATEAARDCPSNSDGVFEYCHIRQYVTWLQRQLFDVGSCPLVGARDQGMGTAIPTGVYLSGFDTLACLYRVVSLKCDCMEAVLNCYEHEYEFTSSLGKTLGKAASVMCGFILCQKQEIYSLLGGQAAIEHSRILQNVLLQVGLMTPRFSTIPPATIVLLSFGLGMVAFIITKKQLQKQDSKIAVEGGYHNLI